MMRLVFLTFAATLPVVHADPQLTSWLQLDPTKYAQIYQSIANETAGTKSTTWTRGMGSQTNPIYAGVSEVNFSTNWV